MYININIFYIYKYKEKKKNKTKKNIRNIYYSILIINVYVYKKYRSLKNFITLSKLFIYKIKYFFNSL